MWSCKQIESHSPMFLNELMVANYTIQLHFYSAVATMNTMGKTITTSITAIVYKIAPTRFAMTACLAEPFEFQGRDPNMHNAMQQVRGQKIPTTNLAM